MMATPEESDIKALWGAQPVDTNPVVIENIRSKADRLESAIRWRNRREYAAALLVIAVFTWYIWLFPAQLTRLGSLLIIAGTLCVCWSLHSRGSSQPIPSQLSFYEYVLKYREELRRQQSALRTVWLWYLAPLVPGLSLFMIGRHFDHPSSHAGPLWLVALIAIGVFAGVWQLNLWAARRLQHAIDDIDTLLKYLGDSPRLGA